MSRVSPSAQYGFFMIPVSSKLTSKHQTMSARSRDGATGKTPASYTSGDLNPQPEPCSRDATSLNINVRHQISAFSTSCDWLSKEMSLHDTSTAATREKPPHGQSWELDSKLCSNECSECVDLIKCFQIFSSLVSTGKGEDTVTSYNKPNGTNGVLWNTLTVTVPHFWFFLCPPPLVNRLLRCATMACM